ncbi:MAG: hypothetical protein IPN94_11465 [Sphingobacteriales bacterium]|nr:hypothetical protein [Sphingobacteriales bacterium]
MSALFVQLTFEKQYFAYLWGKIRAGLMAVYLFYLDSADAVSVTFK